jgi:hypothetical protein
MFKIYNRLKVVFRLLESYFSLLKKAKNKHIEENFVIFYLPELSISTYTKLYKLINKRLKEKNVPTYFIRCFNFYDHCLYRGNNGYKNNIKDCLKCNSSCADNIKKEKFINLSDYLSHRDKKWIKQFLKNKKDNDLLNLQFKGVMVGKLCLYLTFLLNKYKSLNDLKDADYKMIREEIKIFFNNYFVVKNLYNKYGVKNFIAVNEYPSLLGVWCALKGTPASLKIVNPTYHKGILSNYASLINKNVLQDERNKEKAWDEIKKIPISSCLMKESFDDIIFKQTKSSTYTYSPKKTYGSKVKDLFLNKNFEKNIICFPSSNDENFSIIIKYEAMGWDLPFKNDAFSSQEEWISEIINYARIKTQYQFIIRIHPRMGSDHRNSAIAKDLDYYKGIESNIPKNVKLIWPNDPISSYDLADIADLALISWSTMGTEFSRLGIPVLSGIKGHWDMPDKNFIWFSSNKEKYFSLFEELLNKKFSVDEYKLAHRWYGARYLSHTFNMEDVEASEDFLKSFLNNIDPLAIYKENLLKNTEEDEKTALSHNIKSLICVMLLGEVLHNFDISFTDKNSDIYIDKIDGYNIYYIYKNESKHKYSSSAARLLFLYKEAL